MLFLIYLLKVSACLAVFYGLYFFAFRQFTFHTLNRFYLLCTLYLSFIIPLISFETTKVVKIEPAVAVETSPIASAPGYAPAYAPMYDSQAKATIEPADETPDWRFYVVFTYIIVAVIMMLFLCAKLLKIYQLSRQAIKADNLRIVQGDGQLTNASFFNLIFLNTNGLTDSEKAQIIAHECVHIKQLHSIDVLLVELCKIVLWFNPIIYFYKKSLVEVHEFEADLNTVQQFDSKKYAHLLLKLGISRQIDLTNQFSLRPLSTRIQFLFKKRTISIKKVFYFLGLPLLALGIFAFAQRNEKLIYEAKELDKIKNKGTSSSKELKSFDKDSTHKQKEIQGLATINQKDSRVGNLSSMINPFLDSLQASTASEIMLPLGASGQSVRIFAGSVQLQEGIDYAIEPQLGRIKIINQSMLNPARQIRIEWERSDSLNTQKRVMSDTRLGYNLNKDNHIGATVMTSGESTPDFMTRIAIGQSPVNNIIKGFDIDYHFKVPEVALPSNNKITSTTNSYKILIRTKDTPFGFNFDYFKGGRAIVENKTEGNIKIIQDGEELVKDKDYTFTYKDGYISKIEFKEHVQNKDIGVTIILKDLTAPLLQKPDPISLPDIYNHRGSKKQNSVWRYNNFLITPN